MASAATAGGASSVPGAWGNSLPGSCIDTPVSMCSLVLCCPELVYSQLLVKVLRGRGLWVLFTLLALGLAVRVLCPLAIDAYTKYESMASRSGPRDQMEREQLLEQRERLQLLAFMAAPCSLVLCICLVFALATARSDVRRAHQIRGDECDDTMYACVCGPLLACQLWYHLGYRSSNYTTCSVDGGGLDADWTTVAPRRRPLTEAERRSQAARRRWARARKRVSMLTKGSHAMQDACYEAEFTRQGKGGAEYLGERVRVLLASSEGPAGGAARLGSAPPVRTDYGEVVSFEVEVGLFRAARWLDPTT